jgi:hypothetical protein
LLYQLFPDHGMPAFRTFKRGAFNPSLVGKLCTTFGTDTVSSGTEGTTPVAALATALTSALTTTLAAATACSSTFAYIETFSSCFHFSWIYHCLHILLKKQAMHGTACFKTHHHPSPNLERRSSNADN